MTSEAINAAAYQPERLSRTRFRDIRGLACHIREWGAEGARKVFLLHGTQDMSATFQFMVDQCRDDYHFIAPDWRGHGQSGWAPGGYWFHDYIADLDALLELESPNDRVTLVAHSLGGNIAHYFAATRPDRVERLVSLDGFGLSGPDASETPARLGRWLAAQRAGPEPSRAYASVEAFAARLRQAHPKLPEDKALFLAAHSTRRTEAGEIMVAFDPKHRMPFAQPNHRADVVAILRAIAAPVLWLSSDRASRYADEPGGWEGRRAMIRDLTFAKITGASHNVHHDDPVAVARHVEAFLNQGRAP